MKLTLGGAKRKADKAWSNSGREDAECEVCVTLPKSEWVSYTEVHPHHVITKTNETLRWNVRNRCWLCHTHHEGGKKSAHKSKEWFMEWFRETRPADYEHIRAVKNRVFKRVIKDYVKIAEELSHDEKTNH